MRPDPRAGPRPLDATRVTFLLLILTALAQAVFASVPQIDVWVSSLFFDPERGFWMREIVTLERVRFGLMRAVWVIGLPALGLAIVARWGRGRYRTGARPWAFVCASVVLGPGLLVNSILKEFWGRARPADIEAFGGTKVFTPPFQITDQCATNCAFTSGEAASISALAVIGMVLVWPRTSVRQRWMLGAAFGAVALLGSSLRVMTGRHFLSDVLFSALFCSLIIAVLYRVLKMERYRGMTLGDVRADIGTAFRDAGRALRAGANRLRGSRSK